jgi:hypothetical protein
VRLLENLSQQQNALQKKKESLYGSKNLMETSNLIDRSLIDASFYDTKPYGDITDVRVIAKIQEESRIDLIMSFQLHFGLNIRFVND